MNAGVIDNMVASEAILFCYVYFVVVYTARTGKERKNVCVCVPYRDRVSATRDGRFYFYFLILSLYSTPRVSRVLCMRSAMQCEHSLRW